MTVIDKKEFKAQEKSMTKPKALLTIDALLEGHILPGHEDITGSVDKLLDKVAHAKEKMATLRQYYGTN